MDKNKCRVCHGSIVIQIFKNSGICSDNCRKVEEKNDNGDGSTQD